MNLSRRRSITFLILVLFLTGLSFYFLNVNTPSVTGPWIPASEPASPHEFDAVNNVQLSESTATSTSFSLLSSVTQESVIVSTPSERPQLPSPRHHKLPKKRPVKQQRRFTSQVVESVIQTIKAALKDTDLATMFENCFPNTLDTTVEYHSNITAQHPYTFIITGDINAMWIRDSTNQVLPYLQFAHRDKKLRHLLLGVVNLQAKFLSYAPYANAFKLPPELNSGTPQWTYYADSVHPNYDISRVWEVKYELDSLAAFLKISYNYWRSTNDSSFIMNSEWRDAVGNVLEVMHAQMKGTWEEPRNNYAYTWGRFSNTSTEMLLNGHGAPARSCGLVRSAFRPSDDSTVFPYLVPANAMMVVELRHISELIDSTIVMMSTEENLIINRLSAIASEARNLSDTIHAAIQKYAIVEHHDFGRIYAYEVDCYGSYHLMDDANIPSLLSLPYLGYVQATDPIYLNTRAFVLSSSNPWYFAGRYQNYPMSGVGGPHIGRDYVWPMSLAMRALTATTVTDAWDAVEILKATTAGTGFMHEAFFVADPRQFTRKWFAWANGLFGEVVLRLLTEWGDVWAVDGWTGIEEALGPVK